MTKEDKVIFTRRITQGNKSDIIVVLYDIYFAYEEDAKKALQAEDRQGFSDALGHMEAVADHLKQALDFAYPLSPQLFALYDYVQRCLARCGYRFDLQGMEEAASVMKELREAFIEVAKADDSATQMQNAQTVVAGYTYGRGSLNEMTEGDGNRGFFA